MAKRKRSVCVEDLYKFRRVAAPVVSPDGRQVAYVVSAIDRESDQQTSAIFLSPLDGSAAPRVFTQGPHAQSPLWSPDGSTILFELLGDLRQAAIELEAARGTIPHASDPPRPGGGTS